jgi:hypothetical protein
MLTLITIINFLFGIFLIYQIIDNFNPKYVEDFQMLMPIKYPFMSQPFFTNTVIKNTPVNTYYRNAKFHIDIYSLSVESKLETKF